jgi:hypothetical protein
MDEADDDAVDLSMTATQPVNGYIHSCALIHNLTPPVTSGMTGITTYLKQVLCRGRSYKPKFPPGFWSTIGVGNKEYANLSPEKGKQIGRYTDLLFQKAVAGKTKLLRSNYKHRRCIRMFEALDRHGIKCIATQVRVCIPEIGVKTELDG